MDPHAADASARLPGEAIELAVMAKAPLAGYAKTRLACAIGAAAAARLHRQLMLRTLATACTAKLGPITLWCAPSEEARFFRALRRRFAIRLRAQPEGDIGRRMEHAFTEHGARPLLLLGTDCPTIEPPHLQAAARALEDGDDAVLITTEDGGYVLIGLRKPAPQLFAGIDWGTERVAGQTRRRLADLDLRWREIAMLWDVDRAEDLARWRAMQASQVRARGNSARG